MQNSGNFASLLSVTPPVSREPVRAPERIHARDAEPVERPSFEQTFRDVQPRVASSSSNAVKRQAPAAAAEKPDEIRSNAHQPIPAKSHHVPKAASGKEKAFGEEASPISALQRDADAESAAQAEGTDIESLELTVGLTEATVLDSVSSTLPSIEFMGSSELALNGDAVVLGESVTLQDELPVDAAGMTALVLDEVAILDESAADLVDETALLNPLAAEIAAATSTVEPEGVAALEVRYLSTAMSSIMGRFSSSPLTSNQAPVSLASVSTPTFAEGLMVIENELSDGGDDAALDGTPTKMEVSTATGDRATSFLEAYKSLTAPGAPLDASMKPAAPMTLSPTDRTFIVQTAMQVPLGQPQWSQAVGEKVLWFAAQNISAAEIRLDPPELGPMQVRVHVHQDQVNVTFTSQNPQVRDALDQQLNRLREMFSEQGLNLGDVNVSDRSHQDAEQQESGQSLVQDENDDELLTPVGESVVPQRLVDHYA